MEAYFDRNNEIEDYLGKLYCREERQFAAFLYSVFLEKKRKGDVGKEAEEIVKKCLGIGNEEDKITIENVYFEATFMRDFFGREEKHQEGKNIQNKTEFNKKLLEFCMKGDNKLKDKWIEQLEMKEKSPLKTKDGIPYNLGQRGAKQKIAHKIEEEYQKEVKKEIAEKDTKGPQNISQSLRQYISDLNCKANPLLIQKAKEKLRLDIAGMMMNATPDILVQYTINKEKNDKNERTYFKALECKYESGEGRYEDVAGANCKMQFFIQECIMFFLFGPSVKKDYYTPRHPERGQIWRGNKENPVREKVWEEIFGSVYNNILCENEEYAVEKRVNAGVEVIKFVTPNSEGHEDEEKWKEIDIKKLLDIVYPPSKCVKKF